MRRDDCDRKSHLRKLVPGTSRPICRARSRELRRLSYCVMSQLNHPTRTLLKRSPFAASDEEANDRYLAHKSVDPFPEIPSALLNSADLSDYANKTALIFPFYDDDENLKAAAYRVRILGEIVYWEADGLLKSCVLEEDDQFVLAPNSITYITLEPVFRIPDYIKAWFNLDASHVFKGLFLNSGFIDPGFVGRLVLPLHNPTGNEYLLSARDSLIWITLMKISPWTPWEQPVLFNTTVRTGKFRKFPDHKKNPTIEDRLKEAAGPTGSVRPASAFIPGNRESSRPPPPGPDEMAKASDATAAGSAATLDALVKACDQMATMVVAGLKTSAEMAAASQASFKTLTEAKIADATATLTESANRNRTITPRSKWSLDEFILKATLVFAILASSATNISLMKKTENVSPAEPTNLNRSPAANPADTSPPGTSEPQRPRPQKNRHGSKRFPTHSTTQTTPAQHF
jgi:deoxycytidine triphosphate deaminase